MANAGVATRISLASVGLWWLLFSIPLFRRVPVPPDSTMPRMSSHSSDRPGTACGGRRPAGACTVRDVLTVPTAPEGRSCR